ncbi:hypothetical protein NU08_0607 [Flavobacterium anhuiense]|uniref:Uncharacterized protein n=1 Tax=Flavobacterium anhuiense TaxID=459526 RepID=A0A444W1S4_9FLAO|nr:hypothetical protein NU08_0607 [Flavobacterium anhuiense]
MLLQYNLKNIFLREILSKLHHNKNENIKLSFWEISFENPLS